MQVKFCTHCESSLKSETSLFVFPGQWISHTKTITLLWDHLFWTPLDEFPGLVKESLTKNNPSCVRPSSLSLTSFELWVILSPTLYQLSHPVNPNYTNIALKLLQSVVRALDWRSKGQGFESCQEHKKNVEFFWVKKVSLSVCPTPVCIHTHMKDHVRTLKIL